MKGALLVKKTIIQAGPRNDLVIDFHEEYVSPRLLIKQTIGENPESEYNFPEEELNIISERKCSVTMSRQQAIELAHYILDTYGKDPKNDGSRK